MTRHSTHWLGQCPTRGSLLTNCPLLSPKLNPQTPERTNLSQKVFHQSFPRCPDFGLNHWSLVWEQEQPAPISHERAMILTRLPSAQPFQQHDPQYSTVWKQFYQISPKMWDSQSWSQPCLHTDVKKNPMAFYTRKTTDLSLLANQEVHRNKIESQKTFDVGNLQQKTKYWRYAKGQVAFVEGKWLSLPLVLHFTPFSYQIPQRHHFVSTLLPALVTISTHLPIIPPHSTC